MYPLKSKSLRDLSQSGHTGHSLPSLNTDSPAPSIPAWAKRSKAPALPELSELAVVRHFTRLSTLNYSIDGGFYPLGSCTMKYNPRINEFIASNEAFSNIHPKTPPELSQGNLEIMYRLENYLCAISGFSRVSLQPAAGAQGEYTGLRMIRAYQIKKYSTPKKYILYPDSAHGTNPATATMCGYQGVEIPSTENGLSNIDEIRKHLEKGDVAAFMITNPNTCGLYEKNIRKICQLAHEHQALVYCDGANLNALLGITRIADAGVDVMHFNMHKTFTTPHGGGGPGCGGVGVNSKLEPFLPGPTIERDPNNTDSYFLDHDRPLSIGKVKDFYGHFLMMLRAYCYLSELGASGLKKVSRSAILLANYVRKTLEGHYHIAFDRPCLHEVIITDKIQQEYGITTNHIAKRLIDLGFHPPTVYFPLLVKGAMMIEPTETESLSTVKAFCKVMIQIAKEAKEENAFEKYFKDCPRHAPIGKVDETRAARNPILSWHDL